MAKDYRAKIQPLGQTPETMALILGPKSRDNILYPLWNTWEKEHYCHSKLILFFVTVAFMMFLSHSNMNMFNIDVENG